MCKECAIQVKMWGTSYESTGEKIVGYFKKKIKASPPRFKGRAGKHAFSDTSSENIEE
mgnify:CR=1 FL=1